MGGEEEGRDQDAKIFWPRIAPGCGRVLPWLLTSASCANTAELIELPLWAWTRAGPVEPRIRLDPDPHTGRAFGGRGNIWACGRYSRVYSPEGRSDASSGYHYYSKLLLLWTGRRH